MDSITALASTLQNNATLRRSETGKRMLRTQDEDVGLQTVLQQRLHRMLRGLGLQLARSGHIGISVKVHQRRIAVPSW